MTELIKNILFTAQSLEVKGLNKYASQLDSIAESFILIKQAQYDGVQGYWIRNGRCFDNCYRQKRSSSPKKSAQEIWSECHSEWQDSIMNKSSEWDKYADANESMLKIASTESVKNSDYVMNDEISSKIKSGMSVADAVPMTIAERIFSLPWKLAQISNQISDISIDLSEKDPAISERLYELAENIRQESLDNYKDCLI